MNRRERCDLAKRLAETLLVELPKDFGLARLGVVVMLVEVSPSVHPDTREACSVLDIGAACAGLARQDVVLVLQRALAEVETMHV